MNITALDNDVKLNVVVTEGLLQFVKNGFKKYSSLLKRMLVFFKL